MDKIGLSTTAMTRRHLLAAASGAAIAGTLEASAQTTTDKTLVGAAKAKNLIYGAAMATWQTDRDVTLRRTFDRQCGAVVPEYEMKWGAIEAVRGTRNYGGADRVVSFARSHGLQVRGHAAIWHRTLPKWVEPALRAEGIEVMSAHIRDLMAHYKGLFRSWDIVNEAIEPKDGQPDSLRNSPFLRYLGPDYIGRAFTIAAEADPNIQGFYNEYGLYHNDSTDQARRTAVLALLEKLKRDGVPIYGLGIQGHLAMGRPFDAAVFTGFLREVAGLGLKILITELDIDDRSLTQTISERDRLVGERATQFLTAALSERAVEGVLTWGLSDKYSWLNTSQYQKRSDGSMNRCLPYDENFQAKPFWYSLYYAFRNAPLR
jgi:endo-1,4-beta-xylanase